MAELFEDDPLQGFTARSTAVLAGCIAAGILFMVAALSVKAEEDLLIAPWWMWLLEAALIAVAVLVAVPVGRQLPATISRYTRRPSTVNILPVLVLILGILLGHSFVWGWLYRLHPGQQAMLQARVLASGRHSGKAAGGHGAWMDLQLDGTQGTTHLQSGEVTPIHSDTSGEVSYGCSFEDARPGDTLQLQGKRSIFGFAVLHFVPTNPRLLRACNSNGLALE